MTNQFIQSALIDPPASSGGTSTQADFTGANLLVANYVASFAAPDPIAFSDSEGNTWNFVSGRADARVETKTGLFYAYPAIVSATQTFTIGGGHQFQAATINGYRVGVGYLSSNSGATTDNVSSLQPGSITASASPCLVVVNVGASNGVASTTYGVDLSFDITNQKVQGTNYGIAQAFLFQTTASAVNPTITTDGTACLNVKSYTFQMASGVPFCQILG